MKVSTKTLYGLKAVLVLAARFGQGSMSVSQIAKKQGISVPYLEQILNALKKKGFVKSVRGPQGGYVLTHQPANVSLKALFDTLDEGVPAANGRTGADADEVAIANAIFWKKLKESIEEGLAETTLKDLLDESRRLKKTKPHGANYPFHI